MTTTWRASIAVVGCLVAATPAAAQYRRYLAEGATGPFFATKLSLANPDAVNSASVVLTFDSGRGTTRTMPLSLAPGGTAFVDVSTVSGFESSDVSTTIESNRPIAVDRMMEWGVDPSTGHGYGSALETAVPSASTTWFLAEGSTVLGFDLYYLLQNPQATIATVTVRYLLSSGTVVTRTYDMAPHSRSTIYLNAIPGIEEIDVSGDISSNVPIIAERSMYRSTAGQYYGLGTNSIGVTAPATRWFLAEGATGGFFDLYVLFANPSSTDANLRVDYAREDGVVITRYHLVGAHSRFSVYVDSIPGLTDTSVATTVTSTNNVPIVVERAMYWPGGFFDYYEGHTSAGTTQTARRWAIASGDGDPDTYTYVLLANTENRPGQAVLRVMSPSGFVPSLERVVNLPPDSRTTVRLEGMPARYGVLVTSAGASPVELVVESAVYRHYGSQFWASGANALATAFP
ncbi:MAG: hypothetical protein ABIT71_20325 [Vicinamibacteraceae bacterium]